MITCRAMALSLVASLAACGGEGDPEAAQGEVIVVADVGFATPESVRHDSVADIYMVSNINGPPAEKDDNGFISRLSPDGQVEQLKWIDGAAEGVTLHAPKGMGIRGDTLYVADIDCVRRFVRTTGAPAGEICNFQGATFLNDIAVDQNGTLYVTDTGLNPDFSPSGSDAVWRFTPAGQTERIAQGERLGQPNGIAFKDQNAFIVTFGTGEIFQLGATGERLVVLPGDGNRQFDGIEFTPEGSYVYSSWGDSAVYQVDAVGATAVVLESVENPADIGYDATRSRVLVPLFTSNQVIIAELTPIPPPPVF